MSSKSFISFILLIFSILIQSSLSKEEEEEPTCLAGTNFCKKCNEAKGLCAKCQNELLAPDENGGCTGAKVCSPGKHYCETCDPELQNICSSCMEGFFPDDNGACSYTPNCLISFKGHCLVCKENYILLGDEKSFRICKSLSNDDYFHCNKINKLNGFCEECEEGYYLNSGDKKCIKTKNCQESIYGNCVLCKSGYYLDIKDLSTCKQITSDNSEYFGHCIESDDGERCSKCEPDYYYDSEDNCVNSNFCEKAGKNFLCEQCINNYYLAEDGLSCTDEKHCRNGDKYSGYCTWCVDGYFLNEDNGRKCYSNQEEDDLKHCRYFFKGECLVCELGFEVGKDGKCAGSKYCAKSDDDGKCIECQEEFYITDDYKCTKIENCKTSTQYYACAECKDGYELNPFGFCVQKPNDNMYPFAKNKNY